MPPLARMSLEMIDVGKGDAIIVDLRDHLNRSIALVVDGGCGEQAQNVISFLRTHHASSAKFYVSTHSDTDHIGALPDIIRTVGGVGFALNDPRDFDPSGSIITRARTELSTDHRDLFHGALERIDAVKAAAAAVGANHRSWTASLNPVFTWGPWSVYVVGPTLDHFREVWFTPGQLNNLYTSDDENVIANHRRLGTSVLDDGIDTCGLNNQSIMLLIEGPNQKILLTGDAGMRAIRDAAGIRNLQFLTLLDVPHHGSRRNLDTAIINHLRPAMSLVSSPGTDKHPRSEVVRALQAVGSRVYSTCTAGTTSIYYNLNLPRANYTAIPTYPLLLTTRQ